jgi:hypothetical protein
LDHVPLTDKVVAFNKGAAVTVSFLAAFDSCHPLRPLNRPCVACHSARRAVCSAEGIDAAEEMLLRQCLRQVRCGEDTIAPAEYVLLPSDVRNFISAAMEKADPQAATEFQMRCPSCGSEWLETFDVVSFLWTEIADAAARVFREVHDLAVYYGCA